MIVTMHMCAPPGEALRQQWVDSLNTLKRDNRYVINAMLNAGMDVPDTVADAGLEYEPSRHEFTDTGEPIQVLYGMKAMMDSGNFSCGDAAAYEAAVAEEKYGVPTECIAVETSDSGDYHGLYVTPMDVVDPTENWLQYWEFQIGNRSTPPPPPGHLKGSAAQAMKSGGASCAIVDGQVVCDLEDGNGCCVDEVAGVWRCEDPNLNGKAVEIAEVFSGSKSGQRWARTAQGVFVPVCRGTKKKTGNPIRRARRRPRSGGSKFMDLLSGRDLKVAKTTQMRSVR